jgi:hypothetical protein
MKTLISFIILLTLLLSQTGFATESRISLTASDGTALELQKLKARIVLDGFLAFSELEMVFYNPQNRQREGHFQIILPDNAAISRFAIKIADHLQEGEVVEKQQARRAYEDFLHRRQNPALLEIDSGNRFNARIFPIAPKSEKLLILSYSQRLIGQNSEYVLPLKGLPLLKHLSINIFYDNHSFNTKLLDDLTAQVSKRDIITIDKRHYQPTVDLRMPYQPPLLEKGKFVGNVMQSEQFLAARIIPFTDIAEQTNKARFENLILLVDTSASQAPYFLESLKRLKLTAQNQNHALSGGLEKSDIADDIESSSENTSKKAQEIDGILLTTDAPTMESVEFVENEREEENLIIYDPFFSSENEQETKPFINSTTSMTSGEAIILERNTSIENNSESTHIENIKGELTVQMEEIPAGMKIIRTPFGERLVPIYDNKTDSAVEQPLFIEIPEQPKQPTPNSQTLNSEPNSPVENQQIPPGMKIIRTPFGERLVPIADDKTDSAVEPPLFIEIPEQPEQPTPSSQTLSSEPNSAVENQQIPSGMRMVHTPFGERLVPIYDNKTDSAVNEAVIK